VAHPNILLILADDMGYGDFSAFNEGLSQTPTLDQLIREGTCLTQHYAGSAVCAPSRASLLTGRYPHRTGAIDTLEGRGLDRLSLRERTLGDYFGAVGYATGLIGKWHLGALDPRYHPNARGFAEFAGFRGGWQDYYDWRLDRNGAISRADGRYLTDAFTHEAVEFVRRHRVEPFFLHLAYNAPHFPFQAPEEDVRPFAETGSFTPGVSTLYGMIRHMDAGIACILEELQRLGLADNTIVMFTSDNGPQFGGEGDWCTTRFNCQFNGAKGSVLEGGIRVPMIVRWPDGLPAGATCDKMAHFTDWLPTLLAMAGVSDAETGIVAGQPLDGANVLPVLRGEGGDVPTKRFWQWNRYTPVVTSNAAMRDGDWKLVRPALNETMFITREDGEMDGALKYQPETITDICRDPEPERVIPAPPPPLLYNVADDPLEREDVAAREPDRIRRMLRELETWFEVVEADRIAGLAES
jgi:arylsulfatase A